MKTILLVDDEHALLRILERELVDEGFQALTALDGRAGLELATARRPDLIVTDIIMPGMSGRDMIRALAGQEDTRAIPVLVATVVSRQGLLLRDLPLAGYLPKPFTLAAFLHAVRGLTSPVRSPPAP